MANKTQTRRAQPKTKTMIEYDRIRDNFLNQIRGMYRRGYRNLPKASEIPTARQLAQTKDTRNLTADINKLKRDVENIYERATAISDVTGDVISGTERRAEERSASGKKGAQTRKEKKRKKEDEDWKKNWDENDWKKYDYGNQMLYGLMDLIENFRTSHPYHTMLLENALSIILNSTDVDEFAMHLSDMPRGLIEKANDKFNRYDDSDPRVSNVTAELLTFIKGAPLTAKDWHDIENASQMDSNEEVY